jgi:hypothetical protein
LLRRGGAIGLDPRAAIHQMLFDVARDELHFEVVRGLSGDLVHAREYRLQTIQIRHPLDLLIQSLQLI